MTNDNYLGVGIAFGTGGGAVLFALTGSAVFIALGVAIGVAVGTALSQKNTDTDE